MPSKSIPPARPASVPPQLHDLAAAAKRLACSTRHLQREIDRGHVRAVRLGRAVRISEKELRRICEGDAPTNVPR